MLIGGAIIQDVASPLLTHAMWRFKSKVSDGMYDISNRRSGMSLSISTIPTTTYGASDGIAAIADTSTNGCSFCGWTTATPPVPGYEYALYCYDEGNTYNQNQLLRNGNPEFVYPDGGLYWMNFNITDTGTSGAPLSNEFCIEQVVEYQRADVYNSSQALSNIPSGGTSSSDWVGTTLNIASSAVGVISSITCPACAGVSAVLSITSSLLGAFGGGGDGSKTQAAAKLATDIENVAANMAEVALAVDQNVKPATRALNCARTEFSCDWGYVGGGVAGLQGLSTVDDEDKADHICSKLLPTVTKLFDNAFTAFETTLQTGLFLQNPCNFASIDDPNFNTCPKGQPDAVAVDTVRLGWNSIQTAIVDATFYLQEIMFLYSYLHGLKEQILGEDFANLCDSTSEYGIEIPPNIEGASSSDVCNFIVNSQILPTMGDKYISGYQQGFLKAMTKIPPTLTALRMNSNIIVGQAGCTKNDDCICLDANGGNEGLANNVNKKGLACIQCTYEGGGTNYVQYKWEDNYFVPAEVQASYKYTDGDLGDTFPTIPYQDVTKLYYDEIQWDMMNFSYSNKNLTNFVQNDTYTSFLFNTCLQVLNNPEVAMQNHINGTFGQTCTEECGANSDSSVCEDFYCT